MEISTKPKKYNIESRHPAPEVKQEPVSIVSKTQEEVAGKKMQYHLVTELPSKFLPYADAKILITPYSWAEQKALASSKGLSDLVRIVSGGIDSSIPVDSLTDGDFLYLALLRRIYSVVSVNEDRFIGTATCPHCKKQTKGTFTVKDIEFDEIEAPKLPVVVKAGGATYSFMPPRVSDFIEELKSEDIETLETRMIARALQGYSKEEAEKIISTVDARTGKLFDKVASILAHSFKPLKTKCEHCKKDLVFNIDPAGRGVVIEPFPSDGDDAEYTILFGE